MKQDFRSFGFVRVAAVAPVLVLGDPAANARAIIASITQETEAGCEVVLFPELALTGYSCEDLFLGSSLLDAARSALVEVVDACQNITAIVGLPWQLGDGRVLNCAAVIQSGTVVGMVPKTRHPNFSEFYELRWFTSGADVEEQVSDSALGHFLISPRQLFDCNDYRFGIEICEDLWSPEPPSTGLCLAGAEIVFNPSASNELIGKASYRRDLVRMTSARLLCAYVYAGSGPMESTKDIVFGGHLLLAENGVLIAQSDRFNLQGSRLQQDIDIHRLRHERRSNTTFAHSDRPIDYMRVRVVRHGKAVHRLFRSVNPHPFVPDDPHEFEERADEILAIQSTALARRMIASRAKTLVIGLSGGLDSTLAFLVCLQTLAKLGLDNKALHAITSPGPGTTRHTYNSVSQLGATTGVVIREIQIHDAVTHNMESLDHVAQDTVFENIQARQRTQILFNYANQQAGIVVGTGDLSELALGWCTFNADHMANYNVNVSVPKTMIAYLVRWYARHRADKPLAAVLDRIIATPISPELLPARDGEISQRTEEIIGPYELHDFFLYHYLRSGAGPARILALAEVGFTGVHSRNIIKKWLRLFFQRFYTQQFKRTTLPPGPKVGTVSLSPRGDWRMPDEASVDSLLQIIDSL